MAPNCKATPTAMTALLPTLFVCRLFGVAPLRQAGGTPALVWSVLVIMGLTAVTVDMLVREWVPQTLNVDHLAYATVAGLRALCTWSLALLVARRHRVADVLDELLAVADECGRLPRARPKAATATRTTLAMALLVASDAGLLAWDWGSGFRFHFFSMALTLQLMHALDKLVLVMFAAKVRLLVDALADVNRQLAWLARRPPSGRSAARTHTVLPLQALHVRLVVAAERLGSAWGGALLPVLAMVFLMLWGEATWNVAGALRGLYGYHGDHAAFRPSLSACRIGTMFIVLLHTARTCDTLRRQGERTAVTVHGILNREDPLGARADQEECRELAEFALQLAGSRDRFAMSVCGLFDINLGLITTMISTVATYLSIQVPITLANFSRWDPSDPSRDPNGDPSDPSDPGKLTPETRV